MKTWLIGLCCRMLCDSRLPCSHMLHCRSAARAVEGAPAGWFKLPCFWEGCRCVLDVAPGGGQAGRLWSRWVLVWGVCSVWLPRGKAALLCRAKMPCCGVRHVCAAVRARNI